MNWRAPITHRPVTERIQVSNRPIAALPMK